MTTTGFLTDLSLTEILQFIEKGNRTGLLTIYVLPESQATLPPVYYIWIDRGRIVAASNRLDQRGLVSLIEQQQWVSKHVMARLDQFCPIDKALGLCLKSQGALQGEQLRQLFHIQLLQLAFDLYQVKDGQFEFDQNVSIPAREMTGLSAPVVVLRVLFEAVDCTQKFIDQLQSHSEVLHIL